MSEPVLPQWLLDAIPPIAYDRHTGVTGHCHHGRHDRCTSPHRYGGWHHTSIKGRDGYAMQWPGGALAAVHLTVDECSGCHCHCHRKDIG